MELEEVNSVDEDSSKRGPLSQHCPLPAPVVGAFMHALHFANAQTLFAHHPNQSAKDYSYNAFIYPQQAGTSREFLDIVDQSSKIKCQESGSRK